MATPFGPQPDTQRFSTGKATLYGNHVPYDQGTDVRTPDIEAGHGRHADTWNAALINPVGQTILLWITDVEGHFQMDGQTAQSRKHRQFFPHSFAQATVTIKGQVANNFQYNRLASFVRDSHFWALEAEAQARWQRQLGVAVTGTHFDDGTASNTTQLYIRGSDIPEGKTIRGPSIPWMVHGYIKTITAGATRFEFAKEFEFEFVIAFSQKDGSVGIFSDTAQTGLKIATWMDVFKKYQFQDAQKEHYNNEVTGAINQVIGIIRSVT